MFSLASFAQEKTTEPYRDILGNPDLMEKFHENFDYQTGSSRGFPFKISNLSFQQLINFPVEKTVLIKNDDRTLSHFKTFLVVSFPTLDDYKILFSYNSQEEEKKGKKGNLFDEYTIRDSICRLNVECDTGLDDYLDKQDQLTDSFDKWVNRYKNRLSKKLISDFQMHDDDGYKYLTLNDKEEIFNQVNSRFSKISFSGKDPLENFNLHMEEVRQLYCKSNINEFLSYYKSLSSKEEKKRAVDQCSLISGLAWFAKQNIYESSVVMVNGICNSWTKDKKHSIVASYCNSYSNWKSLSDKLNEKVDLYYYSKGKRKGKIKLHE